MDVVRKRMKVKPLTIGQERLINLLGDKENEIVGVFGPSGTGKSLLVLSYALDAVMSEKYRRLVVIRPLIDVTTGRSVAPESLGELFYKLSSGYIMDIMGGIEEPSKVEDLMRRGKIMVTDIDYLRGRTFDESIVFLDDAQNVPPENAAEVLVRTGRDSRLVIAGDSIIQRPMGVERDGATLMREVLLNEERTAVVDLGIKDIVRPGAKRGLKLVLELRLRKRELSSDESKVLDAVKSVSPDADIITVVAFNDLKRKLGIKAEAPDALIMVKEENLGRVVGKGGERIKEIEKETGLRIRTAEMTLDFKQWIKALHPVSWVSKHVADVDFAGPDLQVTLRGEFGAFIGPRGAYVKFLNGIFHRLMGIGVNVVEED
ncbi:MAG: PhoH family protein [Thermocladium sp.]